MERKEWQSESLDDSTMIQQHIDGGLANLDKINILIEQNVLNEAIVDDITRSYKHLEYILEFDFFQEYSQERQLFIAGVEAAKQFIG